MDHSARAIRDAAMARVDEFLRWTRQYFDLRELGRAIAVALMSRVAGGSASARTMSPVPPNGRHAWLGFIPAIAVSFRADGGIVGGDGRIGLGILTPALRSDAVPSIGRFPGQPIGWKLEPKLYLFSDPEVDALQEFPADDPIALGA